MFFFIVFVFLFKDIAVAAPYEDNGVVYIFHGSKTGLSSIPDQVCWFKGFSIDFYSFFILKIIKGSNYNLKTFGFSMSGNLDLDHNKYPGMIYFFLLGFFYIFFVKI